MAGGGGLGSDWVYMCILFYCCCTYTITLQISHCYLSVSPSLLQIRALGPAAHSRGCDPRRSSSPWSTSTCTAGLSPLPALPPTSPGSPSARRNYTNPSEQRQMCVLRSAPPPVCAQEPQTAPPASEYCTCPPCTPSSPSSPTGSSATTRTMTSSRPVRPLSSLGFEFH